MGIIKADYGDFTVDLKQVDRTNRTLLNKIMQIEQAFSRKQNMIDKGLLSEDAAVKINNDKRTKLAQAYVDHVIVGWQGKYNGKALPEYNQANAVAFLSDAKNDLIFSDLIYLSTSQDENLAEMQDIEEKN